MNINISIIRIAAIIILNDHENSAFLLVLADEEREAVVELL